MKVVNGRNVVRNPLTKIESAFLRAVAAFMVDVAVITVVFAVSADDTDMSFVSLIFGMVALAALGFFVCPIMAVPEVFGTRPTLFLSLFGMVLALVVFLVQIRSKKVSLFLLTLLIQGLVAYSSVRMLQKSIGPVSQTRACCPNLK